jgi:2-(1,2-epoxy-1,2-dihydrophenyl)acetyl-CoA isomerase
MSDPLLVHRDGDVLELTLHRPASLNAFTVEMHRVFRDALAQAAAPDVRAVLLTGAGRAFCGGQDLGEATAPGAAGPGHRLGTWWNPNLLALRALDKPVVAAVNGPAAGAGVGLALACDVRLLAEGATLVPAFGAIGLAPDSGTSWLTVRLLGYARAFSWLTSGRRMGAEEARDLGLAEDVVSAGELLDRARARAHELAALPGRAAELTKRLLREAGTSALAEQLDLERDLQQLASEDPAYRERVAAFLSR